MEPTDRKYSPPEACDYLKERHGIRRTPATLAKLRCVSSEGPIFVKANRQVLYPEAGLDDYAASLLSSPRRSTSDRSEDNTRVSKSETWERIP